MKIKFAKFESNLKETDIEGIKVGDLVIKNHRHSTLYKVIAIGRSECLTPEEIEKFRVKGSFRYLSEETKKKLEPIFKGEIGPSIFTLQTIYRGSKEIKSGKKVTINELDHLQSYQRYYKTSIENLENSLISSKITMDYRIRNAQKNIDKYKKQKESADTYIEFLKKL